MEQALICLKAGGIVAIPTETYYGLAVDPTNEQALQSLFRIKQRDTRKAILVLISNVSQLGRIVSIVPDIYIPLIERFWPGPLTLVFPGSDTLSPLVTGGTGNIGVRISSNRLATQLSAMLGGAITATSANISGQPPASTAAQIRHIFGSRISCVIDGVCSGGAASTVVGIREGGVELLRAGQIEFSDILQTLKQAGLMNL